MAKKKKGTITLITFSQAIATFTKETDRGTALAVAAWIDDVLEECLRATLRQDEEVANNLFQPDGPLGTFSSRIKMAYLLGFITPSLFRELETIKGIRNTFAHTRLLIRFTDQSIKDRCNSLVGAKEFQDGMGETIRSPRMKFLISASFATHWLLSYRENAKSPNTADVDVYGFAIQRIIKDWGQRQMEDAYKKIKEAKRQLN